MDGAARIKKVVKRAGELQMPALAITDHGLPCTVWWNFIRPVIMPGSSPFSVVKSM
ncbi:MAG: PHP domain-containing protein [Candidatus Syntrophopropionicum ammoniitolerans]